MYDYISDKDFLKRMRGVCSNIINQLVQSINNDSVMTVEAHLVGSGAKHLETQNAEEPVDLDYNISILETYEIDINEGRQIKEYIRKKFNAVLNANEWGDCQDSTSALTTERRHFKKGNQTNQLGDECRFTPIAAAPGPGATLRATNMESSWDVLCPLKRRISYV